MEQKLKLKLMLDKARVTDLQILEGYRGKEVVIKTPGPYGVGGVITEVGLELVYLDNVKRYYSAMSSLEKYPEKLDRFDKLPNRTLARSQIEEILFLEDIKRQGEKIKC